MQCECDSHSFHKYLDLTLLDILNINWLTYCWMWSIVVSRDQQEEDKRDLALGKEPTLLAFQG